jgi:hypothetical protein
LQKQAPRNEDMSDTPRQPIFVPEGPFFDLGARIFCLGQGSNQGRSRWSVASTVLRSFAMETQRLRVWSRS